MKFGVALATLGLVAQGSAFVPSFNARQSFVGQTVAHAAAPASTRHTRQVLKAVAAAPAVETEVLTRVRAIAAFSRDLSAYVCLGVCGWRVAYPPDVALDFCPWRHARPRLLLCSWVSYTHMHLMNVRSALRSCCFLVCSRTYTSSKLTFT